MNEREGFGDVRRFIEATWPSLVSNAREAPERLSDTSDPMERIYLPGDYVVPGGRFDTMFYWDSYFIMLGLRHLPEFHTLLTSIVENCVFMVERYGRVLNSNKKIWSSRSQLPYLTPMIELARDVGQTDDWIDRAYRAAIAEYLDYWTSGDHLLENGLSRFYEDSGNNYETRHTEASWDMSPRYTDDNTTDLAPVDLNANLYRYEMDIANHLDRSGDVRLAAEFRDRALARGDLMRTYLWSSEEGLFYDYNVKSGLRTSVKSLAAYSPMWVGMVDREQASRLRDNLGLFERDHGLATCDHDYGYADRQWNHPIGWAPLHWITCAALRRYGFQPDARRIAGKWLAMNERVFRSTGSLWEKYDVVRGAPASVMDRYPNQIGFGWTNGVFVDLLQAVEA